MSWLSLNSEFEVYGEKNNVCSKRNPTTKDKQCILSGASFSVGEVKFTFSKLENDASVGIVNERFHLVGDTSIVASCWEYEVSQSCILVKNNSKVLQKIPVSVGTKITITLSIDQKTIEFSCNNVSQGGKFPLVGERFWAAAWMAQEGAQAKLEIEANFNMTSQKPRDFLWTWAARQAHILRYKHLPLNFLIVGKFGVGKSSFFNALCTALQPASVNRIREPLLVGHGMGKENHGTKEFAVYQIPGTNFKIFDLWGSDGSNYTRGEIALLAKGCMLPGFKKDPVGNENMKYTRQGIGNGPIEMWPHAVILAVDGNSNLEPINAKSIRDFTNTVMTNLATTDAGFHELVAVLTRVDRSLDPELRKAPERVYSSVKVREAISTLEDVLKLPPSLIFPVKNYHAERERNFFLEALVLDAFATSVDQGVSFFRNVLKKYPAVPKSTPNDKQVNWISKEVDVNLPTPAVPAEDQKAFDDQLLKDTQAAQQDGEVEVIGPSAQENIIGVEVDDFVWSKYQKEADSLSLFLRSLNITAGDATRRARIAVTMASGNMRNALKFAFSDEYFV